MKNLTPLVRKISYFDSIVSCKRDPSRTHIRNIRAAVAARYTVYCQHIQPNRLENVTATPFVNHDADHLRSCYQKSSGLSKLKEKIRGQQDLAIISECQYCNIAPPDTFDHYLPQGDFPEYAVLSINLIPCCPTCNNKRGEEWVDNGVRTTINYYFDTLPNNQFLFCSISYRGNTPRAIYSLNTANIAAPLQNVIANHFAKLNLLERFRTRSNSEIMDVFDAITPHAGVLTRQQIIQQIVSEATNMQTRRGLNYWRAVCRFALANSNQFLSSAGF